MRYEELDNILDSKAFYLSWVGKAFKTMSNVLVPRYPLVGSFLCQHPNDFAGAYLGAEISEYLISKAVHKLHLEKLYPHTVTLSTIFTFSALTAHEYAQMLNALNKLPGYEHYSGKFDWEDMAYYSAALSLYYYRNRDKVPEDPKEHFTVLKLGINS